MQKLDAINSGGTLQLLSKPWNRQPRVSQGWFVSFSCRSRQEWQQRFLLVLMQFDNDMHMQCPPLQPEYEYLLTEKVKEKPLIMCLSQMWDFSFVLVDITNFCMNFQIIWKRTHSVSLKPLYYCSGPSYYLEPTHAAKSKKSKAHVQSWENTRQPRQDTMSNMLKRHR